MTARGGVGGGADNAAREVQRGHAERDHPQSHGVRQLGGQDQAQENLRHQNPEAARSSGAPPVHRLVFS